MNRELTHPPAGFTLVETIIYLALLAILMSGAVASFYSIEQGSVQNGQDATTATEGSFVIAKIDWALAQASSVAAPLTGQRSTLMLHTRDHALDPIVISVDNESEIIMTEGNEDAVPITTKNVAVDALTFAALTDARGTVGIAASFTLDGETFETRAYLFP